MGAYIPLTLKQEEALSETDVSYNDWPIPEGLSPKGRAAAEVMVTFFKKHGIMYHGGGGKFYTPAEWKVRGERYGTSSLLVITHDGGTHAVAIDYDSARSRGSYRLLELLVKELEEVGVYLEQCTGWYSAVYEQ